MFPRIFFSAAFDLPRMLISSKKCADDVRKTSKKRWLVALWHAPGDIDLICIT